jgi:molecular chaperone GrpE
MNSEDNAEDQFDDIAASAAEDQLSQLTKERDDAREQVLRVQAEFQNALRRQQSMVEIRRNEAIGAVASDVLDVMDNFERALESARGGGSATAGIVSGLEMVQKQFLAALAKHKVMPIEALNQTFDPTQHEAVMQRPSSDQSEPTVLQVLAQGYRLGDRVLRPAKVIVSTEG